MKTTKIISLLLIIVLVSGCKRNGWLDWKIENQLWLQENATKEGIVTTPTGLQYKCIDAGPFATTENPVRPDDTKIVTITYTGRLINGYIFDAGDWTPMYVNTLIAGFAEGLKKMYPKSKYEFYIPYNLAYGKNGSGVEGSEKFIPPYSTLIFHVELQSID